MNKVMKYFLKICCIVFFITSCLTLRTHGVTIEDSNLLLINYIDTKNEDLEIQILINPSFEDVQSTFMGETGIKIHNKIDSTSYYIELDYFGIAENTGFKEKVDWFDKFNKNDVKLLAGELAKVLGIKVEEEKLTDYVKKNIVLYSSEFEETKIQPCEQNDYATQSLDKKYIFEEKDTCLILGTAPISFYDLNYDNKDELIVVIPFQGQRYSHKYLIFEFNGNNYVLKNGEYNASIPIFDNHWLNGQINLSKKIIADYSDISCCDDSYTIYQYENNHYTKKYIDGWESSEPFAKVQEDTITLQDGVNAYEAKAIVESGLIDANHLHYYLSSHFANGTIPEPRGNIDYSVSFLAASVDLDHDGVLEVLAEEQSSGNCGSGGCTMSILKLKDGWQIVANFFGKSSDEKFYKKYNYKLKRPYP